MGCSTPCSLCLTISPSLLKLLSIESMMPSNHLVLCRLFLLLPSIFTSIRVFSNESALHIKWATSTSVLPVNIQSCFPFGLTGLISMLSKAPLGFFSSTTVQKHQFLVLSFPDGPALISVHDYRKIHSFDYINLCWQSIGV